MKLADDERGRVPFALVGVVLLVASATAATVLAGREAAPDRTRGDRALDRARTGVDAALASATRTALRNAARNPVVSPADSRYGAALGDETAFRDALALRVYARFERALRTLDATAGGVSAVPSLPRVQTTRDAERAVTRTTVRAVDESTVEVSVAGVETTVTRDGRPLDRRDRAATVRVQSAALALHHRTQAFERRLDTGAVQGAGLDRRLTDLLHRVVWLRGPLQYAGAPVGNVLANRHVALAANRALLDQQAAAFGRQDDAGGEAYARAFAETGLRDVLAAGTRSAKSRAATVLDEHGGSATAVDVGFAAAEAAAGASEQTVPVSVNATADRAFVGYIDGTADRSLAGTLDAALVGIADRSVAVTREHRRQTTAGRVPDDWRLVRTSETVDTAVKPAVPRDATVQGRRVRTAGRRVVTTATTARRYRNGSRTQTVTETTRTTHRVTVGVGYSVDPPIRDRLSAESDAVLDADAGAAGSPLHQRYARCATRRLLDESGGVDAIARRAVTGAETAERRVLVRPDIPASVRERSARALARLRDDARNATVAVSTGGVADSADPSEALARRVRQLHDVDTAYETVEGRAVAAARETYLALVVAALRERDHGRGVAAVGAELADRGVQRPPASTTEAASGGPVTAVEGTPPYLTLGAVTPETADVETPYHPLAARNENWFTAPHGAVAESVVSAVLPDPPDSVGLGRAGQTLAGANRALDAATNGTLARQRDALQTAVRDGLTDARIAYGGVLASSSVSFSDRERRTATRRALARWPTAAARATAVANGSAARAVAAEAAAVAAADARQRDRLAARLRANADRVAAKGRVRVDTALVRDTAQAAHAVVESAATAAIDATSASLTEAAARRAGVPDMGALPAGLPLAPVPGSWYATANAWSVGVRGSWATFTVRADGGSPIGPGNGTAYVRTDEPVSFDVNGDGRPDRVGANERVSFRVEATVGVVVPPGPRGVGDTAGGATETSPGW